MGNATITETTIWEAPVPGARYSITAVGPGGPGTNGFDTGTTGGVGFTGQAGAVVTVDDVALNGTYYVEIGGPQRSEAEVPTGVGCLTRFGHIVAAPHGGTNTVRVGPASGDTNGTGYGSGGDAGDPDNPIDTTGQAGAVLISWDD